MSLLELDRAEFFGTPEEPGYFDYRPGEHASWIYLTDAERQVPPDVAGSRRGDAAAAPAFRRDADAEGQEPVHLEVGGRDGLP